MAEATKDKTKKSFLYWTTYYLTTVPVPVAMYVYLFLREPVHIRVLPTLIITIAYFGLSFKYITIFSGPGNSGIFSFSDFFFVYGLFIFSPLELLVAFFVAERIAGLFFHMSLSTHVMNFNITTVIIFCLGLAVGAPIGRLTPQIILIIIVVHIITELYADVVLEAFRRPYNHWKGSWRIATIRTLPGIIFGISCGVATFYSVEAAIFSFIGPIIFLFVIEKYFELSTDRERYELFTQFFENSENLHAEDEIENYILTMAKKSLRREDIIIRAGVPGKDEVGELLSSTSGEDRYIVFPTELCSQATIKVDSKILHTVASMGSRMLEQYELHKMLNQAALDDPLTGISNRRAFEKFLEHDLATVKRGQGTLCVLYIDLDDFKPINDKYGHAAGDQVLKEVGERLASLVREQDSLARLGGDEFAILCRELNADAAAALSRRISTTLEMPISVQSKTGEIVITHVGASIGLAHSPENGTGMEELMAAADHSMYATKSRRKARPADEQAG